MGADDGEPLVQPVLEHAHSDTEVGPSSRGVDAKDEEEVLYEPNSIRDDGEADDPDDFLSELETPKLTLQGPGWCLSFSSHWSLELSCLTILTDSPLPSDVSPKVRFRSRVRIGSLRRHNSRGNHSKTPSTSSSVAGSASSSLSAPLRSAGNASDSNGWGSLGTRVSGRRRASIPSFGERQPLLPGGKTYGTTPMMAAPPQYRRGHRSRQQQEAAIAQEDRERLRRDMDALFGRWPQRLLNYRVRQLFDTNMRRGLLTPPTVVVVASRAYYVLSLP